jgi:hypothetical protein
MAKKEPPGGCTPNGSRSKKDRLSMNTAILAQPTVAVSPNIPAKQLYWQGYDQYILCSLSGDWLSPEEYASMLPEERRGYEAAGRHAADSETYTFLASTNSFGDRTEW